jgi:hypothetical protein
MIYSKTTQCENTKYLQYISGLFVTYYIARGITYYIFSDISGRNLKTVCTYKKAKVFAQGIEIGRKLNVNKL